MLFASALPQGTLESALRQDVNSIGDFTGGFEPLDVAIVLCLSFTLSLVIGKTYQMTHKGISYSQGNVQTYVLMAVVIALIMLVIGSNIARAFSLVGALSIVRFRNAVKESRDVGFVFWAMAVGMTCGTRFYLMAVFATVVIAVFVFAMHYFNFFARTWLRTRACKWSDPARSLKHPSASNSSIALLLRAPSSSSSTAAGVCRWDGW